MSQELRITGVRVGTRTWERIVRERERERERRLFCRRHPKRKKHPGRSACWPCLIRDSARGRKRRLMKKLEGIFASGVFFFMALLVSRAAESGL